MFYAAFRKPPASQPLYVVIPVQAGIQNFEMTVIFEYF